MAALMTSMRLKQIAKLSVLVNNSLKTKVCVCSSNSDAKQHKFLSKVRFCSTSTGSTTVEDVKDSGEQSKDGQTKDDAKSWKQTKRALTMIAIASGVFSTVGGIYVWGSPDEDAEGREIQDSCSEYVFPISYLTRSYLRFRYEVKVTREPSRLKLLPDPLKYPYLQPKYTLVIEMTDVLVHPDWTYKTGWRFKKRPGIDVFLRAVGPPLFEVVIFTREQGMTADPIITKADPENFIMYRLYRDATRYEDGFHVKDLRYLNRDLSKVIMIDWDKQALKFTPENGFIVKKWSGDNNDTVLGELAEFMRAIAASNVDDVRPVLQYYSQFDEPLAKFHENQMKLKEEQDRQARVMKAQTEKSLTGIASFWRKR